MLAVGVLSCTKENDNVVIPEVQYPSTPTNISPVDGATGLSNEITFSWYKCTDPQSDPVLYDILVCSDADMTSIRSFANNITGTSVILDFYYPPTLYWRVTARDNHGNYSEGPVWHLN